MSVTLQLVRVYPSPVRGGGSFDVAVLVTRTSGDTTPIDVRLHYERLETGRDWADLPIRKVRRELHIPPQQLYARSPLMRTERVDRPVSIRITATAQGVTGFVTTTVSVDP